jgi:hypothetical protein
MVEGPMVEDNMIFIKQSIYFHRKKNKILAFVCSVKLLTIRMVEKITIPCLKLMKTDFIVEYNPK